MDGREPMTEEEFDDAIAEVIIEAILDGRLPCDDEIEFEHLTKVGLELGIVTACEDGTLQLSRDLEIAGQVMLELSQEQEEGLELEQVAAKPKRTFSGKVAGAVGAAAGYTGAAHILNRSGWTKGILQGASTQAFASGNNYEGLRSAAASHRAFNPKSKIGQGIMSAARKHPKTALAVGTAGLIGSAIGVGRTAKGVVDNALTRNAEARKK